MEVGGGEAGALARGEDTAALAVAHGVHRGLYAAPGSGDLGFLDMWSTSTERACTVEERLAIFLVCSYRVPPGVMDVAARWRRWSRPPGRATWPCGTTRVRRFRIDVADEELTPAWF